MLLATIALASVFASCSATTGGLCDILSEDKSSTHIVHRVNMKKPNETPAPEPTPAAAMKRNNPAIIAEKRSRVSKMNWANFDLKIQEKMMKNIIN